MERGDITRPIKDPRFTHSYVEALREVDMVGRGTRPESTDFSYKRVPPLKLPCWNFVSATTY